MPNSADIYDALFTLTFCKVVVNSRCKDGARYANIIWYRYFAREFENQIYFLFTMSYCRLDRNCSVRTFCNSTVIFHRFCLHQRFSLESRLVRSESFFCYFDCKRKDSQFTVFLISTLYHSIQQPHQISFHNVVKIFAFSLTFTPH